MWPGIFRKKLRARLAASLIVVLAHAVASAQTPIREIRPSPDGRFFVGWFDYDAGPPMGVIRPVVLRSTTDSHDIFSFVSVPRSTEAAWSPGSSRCVIADAPDNGGPKTWLIYQKTPQDWAARELDPFAVIYAEFRKADPEVRHLFRPSILKMTWLSDTEVRFRGYCNSGTYLMTIDTTHPELPPATVKLSEAWLEE